MDILPASDRAERPIIQMHSHIFEVMPVPDYTYRAYKKLVYSSPI